MEDEHAVLIVKLRISISESYEKRLGAFYLTLGRSG